MPPAHLADGWEESKYLESRLLAVWGRVQREGDVLHVIPVRMADYSDLLGEFTARSRDFA